MRIAVSFTGGKDSSVVASGYLLARRDAYGVPASLVRRLLQDLPPGTRLEDVQVALLVTFAPAGGSTFKAHPLELIKAQAAALGVPHQVCEIKGPDFLASYRQSIQGLRDQAHGIQALATGDILDVCSNFMGRACEGLLPLLRPLWLVPRGELLAHVWALGLAPRVSCVNVRKLVTPGGDTLAARQQDVHYPCHYSGSAKLGGAGGAQAGREQAALVMDPVADLLGQDITPELHMRLLVPACQQWGVDECGEMGEFHTMCLDGRAFRHALELEAEQCYEPGAEFAFLSVRGVRAVAKAGAELAPGPDVR